ncbi:endo-1,4-beta-xylanase [Sorangium sp. So ce1036]|uniref:endo-1,4-beta-xylanase n=1 Tax=Sorangium sp. So ce1036 TaxID=3133328 RepID=UPI003F03C977
MRSAPLTLLLSAFLCAIGCSDGGDGGGETGGGGGVDATSGTGGAPGVTTGTTGATTGTGGAPGVTTGTTGVTTGTGGAPGVTTGTGGTDGTGGGTGGSDGNTGGGGSTGGPAERTPAASASTLREAGEKANPPLLIGAAISASGLNDGNYSRVAAAEHNYVTAENEMKWDALEPNPGQFSWGSADRIVSWAQQNNMKVKGHTLVWHSQLPGWMNNLRGAQQVEQAMRRHIENVMGHFKGKVEHWDVVNEAVLTDSDTGVGNPRMRPTVFYNELGEQYLDLAFKIAREQDPSVKLYYNDYSIDARNDKADFVYEMIKGMVERGVPIDGVGFQMHIGPPNNEAGGEDVAYNLKRFADLGLEVLISEMDINRCGNQVTAEEQLTYYHDIVEACFLMPKCVAVTFWGINDGRSWLNSWSTAMCNGGNSQSLLFNDQYQKKETYNRVMDALLGR